MFKTKFALCIGTLFCFSLLSTGIAQVRVQDRIKNRIDPAITATVKGNVHPLARAEHDRGNVPAAFKIERVTMMFKMTAAQQADLNKLLQAQQDSSSADYHRWLAPEEYAVRFGISANDRDKVLGWLRQQGFTVNEIGRNGRSVSFTGSAAQIESAFHTSIHQYNVDGATFYANASEPSVPAAMADMVLGFRALNNFRMKPRPNTKTVNFSPQFTSSLTGNHFLSPSDFATIYDLNSLYANGIDGTGQSIAIAGQTEIDLNDIRAFRTASGLPQNDPQVVLIPGATDPGIIQDDLAEADLDIEWAGAVAPNAKLIFVTSTNVLDSLQYAVDQKLAPIVSISYGSCEQNFSPQDINALSAIGQQANAQGTTILAASGDTGAADCESQTSKIATHGLAVDAPASLPYVTAMGGSEFHETSTNAWSSTNTAVNGSALAYIPEIAWNDTSLSGTLAASGGGSSIYFSKPSWQLLPGVPNDSARDVPDLSLNASSDHDGYLVCSGGGCVNGFRASNGNLFIVGGTSVAAPSFAGILALINQKTGNSQGNINPILYSLASTVPSAFHDITSGGNQVPCVILTANCPNGGSIGFSAGPGYDQATGIGSVDVFNLIAAWPMPQSSGTGSTTPASGGTDGSPTPTPDPSSTATTVPQPIGVVEQGAIRAGYAIITPDSSSSAPTPTVTYGIVNGGTLLAQAGLTPIPMITDGSLFADVIPGIGRNLGVAIVNIQNTALAVNITLLNLSGNTVGSPVVVTLSPHQQLARFVTELFPSTVIGSGFTGSLRLQSSASFGALGLRFSGSEFSTLPVVVTSAASNSSSSVIVPQFAMGGGWATQLALLNNASAVNSGRIDVFDTAGNPMTVTMNGATQSSFTYSILPGGGFVLAPRDSNNQSPF